ncbi:3',5'-cyclic adenosine monophosphate phosphodiesterase CpdA [Rhodococcus olei]|uniref:3',5'-cyclic adenosine monophosphate phosphodiesterase CpdA n=1 Tax=Rhodococcus olei TaxID=2161675 RepID=A0ABP8P5X3_9NOCA
MSQYGEPDHYILHVSDTHLVSGGDLLHGKVDSARNLNELFARLESSGQRPEAIVFTGDLADAGSADAYARLREIVEPVADRIGAQVIWVMGNHDERGAFRAGLLDSTPTDEPVDAVHDVGGLRIVVLDTTVPGHHHGEVTADQLEWLRGVLATPASHGTLLALHHPPVPSPDEMIEMMELRGQAPLEEVLSGTDVRGILAGHLHYSQFCTFAGIPVSVASATCYTADVLLPAGEVRGQDGAQAVNLVHVYRDRVLHSVVPIERSPTVYEMNLATLRRFQAMSPEEQAAAAAAHSRGEPANV